MLGASLEERLSILLSQDVTKSPGLGKGDSKKPPDKTGATDVPLDRTLLHVALKKHPKVE